MASSKEYKDFVLEQLRDLKSVSCKPMMGEFLLYFDGILFGGIYDNRFLLKKTNSNKKFLLAEVIPYEHAKPMYLVENLDDVEHLAELVKTTCDDLKQK